MVAMTSNYDLRSEGRGPRGFRVGRELRFRLSEVEAWITSMEAADTRRLGVRSWMSHPEPVVPRPRSAR